MKHTIYILSLAALLMLFACKKDQTPVTGSISGNLSAYDPATPLVTTPVEGIKLYLIDADFDFDTITFSGNKDAVLDSTFSDAGGDYRFSNIGFGNYWVSPALDTAGYRFEPVPAGNIDPLQISETAPDQTISFSSPWPGSENSQFIIKLTVNRNGNNEATYFHWGRQWFVLCIPAFVYIGDPETNEPLNLDILTYTRTQYWDYGWTGVFVTETNNFLLTFYNANDVLIDSYWITQDLGNTPAQSWWTIDLNAHTITNTGK